MVKKRTGARIAVAGALLAGALWYLRDPPWIAGQTTGMWDWEQAADGTRFRWTTSHASFFVPSDASEATLRIATTFDDPGAQPILVTISVDDARAARLVLMDAAWHEVIVPLYPRGSRHQRRIDLRTNLTREDNRALRLGEVHLTRTSQ
ncbi:MAG TPA: hypothetical protein VFZ98_06130 [Vicinamibacterales bacterium]